MSRRKPETIDALTDFFMFADYAAACVARDRIELIMGIRGNLEGLKATQPPKRGRPAGSRTRKCYCPDECALHPALSMLQGKNAATEGEPTR